MQESILKYIASQEFYKKSLDVVAAYFNSRGDVLGNPRWHDV